MKFCVKLKTGGRHLAACLALVCSMSQGANAEPQPPGVPDVTKASSAVVSARQQFLDAAKNGTFIGIYKASPADQSQFARSILEILNSEPVNQRLSKQCGEPPSVFTNDVIEVFSQVTLANTITLSDEGPNFESPSQNWLLNSSKRRLNEIKSSSGPSDACFAALGGKASQRRYMVELTKLADEYSQATQSYVVTERGRRMAAYQVRLQQRNDAESARIAEAEDRRQVKERIRTGNY